MSKHARCHSRTFLSLLVRIASLTWVFVSLTSIGICLTAISKWFLTRPTGHGEMVNPSIVACRKNQLRKMTIMPRFLFLFQAIPVFIPKSFFKDLHKLISAFIWNRKVPRIWKEYLERQKGDGGLYLPKFLYYYWAANIHKLMFWVSDVSDDDSLVWCQMSNPVSLCSLICSSLLLSKRCWTNNPIISGCLKTWVQFGIHFKHKQALVTSPILANINFAPSLTDPSFQFWHRRGIKCVMDLFKVRHFISFEQFKKDFSISQSDFFRSGQVQSYVKTHFSLTTRQSTW